MKRHHVLVLILCLLLAPTGEALHAQSASYEVPVGSRANTIILTVANGSKLQATGALEVRLLKEPKSIVVGQSLQSGARLTAGGEADFSFSFEVKRAAVPQKTDTLRFLIVDKDRGTSQEKLIALSYSGPKDYRLFQNYPNPFNPRTTIAFDLPEESRLTLKVYDVLGREVMVLADEERPAGCYDIPFEAGRIASGVYFYRLTAEPKAGGRSFADVKKLMVLK